MGLKSILCAAAVSLSVTPALAQGDDALVNKTLGTPICAGMGDGLHAIEVDWDAACDSKVVDQARDLTLPEAARQLKINVGSIRSLRDNGYLREVLHQNPDTNRAKTYISWSSIQRFQARYVTLGQMAQRQKMASIHLARRLDREDMPPVNCGERLVRVYDKRLVHWE